MVLNTSITYHDGQLTVDQHAISTIIDEVGTPTYIYSLPRALSNYAQIKAQFEAIQPHIHYSVKANGNLAVLRALIKAGAGVDVLGCMLMVGAGA